MQRTRMFKIGKLAFFGDGKALRLEMLRWVKATPVKERLFVTSSN